MFGARLTTLTMKRSRLPTSAPKLVVVQQSLKFGWADIDIPQDAAKRADLQIAIAVDWHRRTHVTPLKEVMAASNAHETEALSLQNTDHFAAGASRQLSHARARLSPNRVSVQRAG